MNTVSHMQKDLAILREENRVLKTRATSQVIQAPRRAALTTTKVPRFDGTTSWEQYQYSSIATVLAFRRRCVKRRPLSTAGATIVTIRTSRCINGPLWFSGSAGGLLKTVRTNHQNNQGRPGKFCNSLRNTGC